MIILYLSGICSHCLKLFGNGVNKQEAGLVNMPKPAPRRMAIIVVGLITQFAGSSVGRTLGIAVIG